MSTSPPQSISLAKPMAPGASGSARWLSTLPIDQLMQAIAIAASPAGDDWNPAPCVSISTPARPMPMPATSKRLGTTFQTRLASTINSGTTAMKATTSPEPTVCSATAVPPMPPPSIRPPTINALRHWRASGHRVRRTNRIHSASATPATRKREPMPMNGGKLTSANLMAR